MNVNLHIERLVIDGLPVDRRDAPAIEAALAEELTRLIGEAKLGDRLGYGGPRPPIRTAPIAVPAANGASLGSQIGRAVFQGMIE